MGRQSSSPLTRNREAVRKEVEVRTYVFFDKNTGSILHVHAEAALTGEPLPTPKVDLLAMDLRLSSGEQIDRRDLDVMEVDLDLRRPRRTNGKELYVDVQRRVLSERDARLD
jgi:hypothetical protein